VTYFRKLVVFVLPKLNLIASAMTFKLYCICCLVIQTVAATGKEAGAALKSCGRAGTSEMCE
jgi:hypothetical protein